MSYNRDRTYYLNSKQIATIVGFEDTKCLTFKKSLISRHCYILVYLCCPIWCKYVTWALFIDACQEGWKIDSLKGKVVLDINFDWRFEINNAPRFKAPFLKHIWQRTSIAKSNTFIHPYCLEAIQIICDTILTLLRRRPSPPWGCVNFFKEIYNFLKSSDL